jgi:DNA invertase Pin-like site-specific DNA recombinase
MENVWAFYRRSTDKQELSIDDQRRECRAFAAAHGWDIVREFEPANGYASGLSIERDVTFQEMVRAAESRTHGVRYLVVYDVSRFGRLVTDEKIYWEQVFKKRGGIQIIYVHGDFKNDGSLSDTLLKVVKHAEAHEYSVKLSEVTLRGAKSHSALGHSAGGVAPFGYDRLEIDPSGRPVRVMNGANDWKSNKLHHVVWTASPTKAPIVRWVFETYDQGTGLNLLAHGLNERKVSAPRGGYWSKTAVRYLIRNRAYLGERIYNRRSYKAYRRGERVKLSNPADAWVIKKGAHDPIIDADLFERVQNRIKTRLVSLGRTVNRPYLLTGIARCAQCGYRMIGQPTTGNGHRYLTYTCSGYLRIGKAVCRSVHVLAESLETEVVKSIRVHLSAPAWKEEVRAALKIMVAEEFGDQAKSRVDETERQLVAVGRQITNIVEAVKLSASFSEAMRQALADLELQRDALRARLREAAARTNKQIGADIIAEKIVTCYGNFERIWREGLTLEERKELLRCYVYQINLHHSPTDVKAEIWLYKIPVPKTQVTPALNGLEPLITRVSCGGRYLPRVTTVDANVLPYIVRTIVSLKRPYVHYPVSAA